MHADTIIQTEQVIFRSVYPYTYMNTITISWKEKREATSLKKRVDWYMEGSGERKRKGEK